jgi:PAS domain S-box-containing protein
MKKQIANKTKKSSISSKKIKVSTLNNTTEDALMTVLENIPIGVLIYDLSNVLFANSAAYKIFNHSKRSKKITDYSVFDFLLPEYHQLVKHNAKKLFKGEKIVPKIVKVKNEKGKVLDLEVKSNAILFKGKKAIQTVFSDVTLEVNSEKLRKEIEEKFKHIVENANDLIYFYTYHPKPQYIYVSPSVKRILGYSPNEFYNNPFFGLSIITERGQYDKLEKEVARKQKNGTLKRSHAVFQYRAKSGKLLWLEDDYSPIYDENGKIKWILYFPVFIVNR